MIAGVDGCKRGWIAALDDEAGHTRVETYESLRDLLNTRPRLIVIDIPIGLMEMVPRAADQAARALLRHRACCVFSAPYRAMLGAGSLGEACAIRERIDGKRCTQQAFRIIDKIKKVDELMTPAHQERVREGHAEVTFAVMCGGTPIEDRKKSAAGRATRVAVLRPFFPDLDASSMRLPQDVARDDVLDAYAMVWTARRVVAGTAHRLPEVEQRDPRGLRVEVVA
jgi:predicted RNase H-like nuclease